MSYEINQNQTAEPLPFLMIDSADHLAGLPGLSPTVTISKNGAAFAAPAGAVTEISSGWYKVAGNATDANTLGPLALHATSAGADPTDSLFRVVVPPASQASVDTVDTVADAILADTGTDGVVLSAATANQVADATLVRANGIETGMTLKQAMRAVVAFVSGTSVGAGTTSILLNDPSGGTARIDMTVNASTGERTAVVLNL